MAKLGWEQREEWLNYLREMRDCNPPPLPLRDAANIAVANIEGKLERGEFDLATAEWVATNRERLVESVYQEFRQLEARREQIYTQAASRADARTVILASTQGMRNPTTGAHERLVTKTINREQFRRWRARQLVLFATEAEKLRWSDEVSAFWDKNPDLPTLEAVCAAAGIPFEPALAAEMA